MNFLLSFSRVHPARLAKGLTTLVAAGLLMISVGCGDGSDPADFAVDASASPAIPAEAGPVAHDAATSFPVVDASVVPVSDAGSPASDAGGQPASDAASQPTSDAGDASTEAGSIKAEAGTDAGAEAGGGFVFPDLFPKSDAGPAPTPDGGTGGRDVNGPCKDLNLLCFDFIDMYFNAECFTCNSGKGCMGCAIPFAY